MQRVFTYSLADDLIERIAALIEEKFSPGKPDLSRLALCFGGRRPSLFLRKALSRRFRQTFFAPRFFSMDEFVEYLLRKKSAVSGISDLDACFLLYKLAKEIMPESFRRQEKFSLFLPWAKEILGFMEQLDFEDIDPKSLSDIQLHADIGYDVPQSINLLLSRIVVLRQAFAAALAKEGAWTRGMRYQSASRAVSEVSLDEFDEVFFCNIFYLHATEERLIKNLYQRQKAVLIFQGSSKDWTVLKKIEQGLAISIQPAEEARPDFNLTVYAGHDLHAQACWAREILKTIRHPERAVIVLPDPGTLIPLLSEISFYSDDFNVSMGYPLTRSPLYALFESIFRAQETGKGRAYYGRDYLRVLAHPYVKNLDFSGQPSLVRVLVHKIEEVLSGAHETILSGSLFIEPAALESLDELYSLARETAKPVAGDVERKVLEGYVRRLHYFLFYLWEDISTCAQLTLKLEEFINFFLEEGRLDLRPLDKKMFGKLFSVLQEFRNSSFRQEPLAKDDILKIFKDKLEGAIVSFSGSPLKGLQILGLFETRSLSFEDVIIMGVNESVLPKLKIYEPLIPRDVCLSLGLNRLEKEEEIQRYQFRRLVSSARNVHLIYQDSDDKEKSRFIEELVWERQKSSGSLDVLPVLKAGFNAKVLDRSVEVKKRPQELVFLRGLRFSASSLNMYLSCPLRFYYQYVLGLKEKSELLEGPEASDIGSFVHSLLEETFSGFIGKRPRINARFRDYFFAALDKKFDEEFKKRMRSDAFLTRQALVFRLNKFLLAEEERSLEAVVSLETPFEDNLSLSCGDFRFICRVDRIDRLKDGSLLIIDYKTGGSSLMPMSPDRIRQAGFSREALKRTLKSFQLPLYIYLLECREREPRVNAGFYNLKETGSNFGLKTIFTAEGGFGAKDGLMEVFLESLESMVSEIQDAGVAFAADKSDPRACRRCPFFYLCR